MASWKKDFRTNIKAMRESTALPAGLVGALFGRMVTSDTEANITAPVHVAHAFTVHEEEAESDYFTAVDDLSGDEPGADTIQATELTSGLFYGYVVVDIPGLLSNLKSAAQLASEVLHHLVHLIAEVTPGAKLGSTAPYARASFMLLEAGDRQPRSLAEAFRKPSKPQLDDAVVALASHLAALDATYATGETRLVMSLADVAVLRAVFDFVERPVKWESQAHCQSFSEVRDQIRVPSRRDAGHPGRRRSRRPLRYQRGTGADELVRKSAVPVLATPNQSAPTRIAPDAERFSGLCPILPKDAPAEVV